jgi:protein tyrosine phosphatase
MKKFNMDIYIRYFQFSNNEVSTCLDLLSLCILIAQTNELRTIVHYQYIEWPDFGAPSSPTAFMSLVHLVDEQNQLHPESPLCMRAVCCLIDR